MGLSINNSNTSNPKKFDNQYYQDTKQLESDNQFLTNLLKGVKQGRLSAIQEAKNLSIFTQNNKDNNYNGSLLTKNNSLLEEAKKIANLDDKSFIKENLKDDTVTQIRALLLSQGDNDITEEDIVNYLNNK